MSRLISKILEFADEHEMLSGVGVTLVCVSGGADSMCLFEVLRHISYERDFGIAVAHYNHNLRGDESDRDETFVMLICEHHGIPFYSGRGDVSSYAKSHGLGIEEAARDMRYEFFFNTADKIGAAKIATAHTMNDNAETMLINLARGAGTNGMSGIPPVRDSVVRPLLKTTRDEVIAFINERDIPFVEDSTNALEIHTRNKVRHSIIPLIEKINPRFCEAASVASQLFRADEDFISDIADLFIQDCCMGLTSNAADLAVLPFSVSSRVIRKLYVIGTQDENSSVFPPENKRSISLSFNHVLDVLALCESENPSASLSLPGMTVYREYERVIFDTGQKPDENEFAPIYPTIGNNFIILSLGLKISCKSVVFDDNIKLPTDGATFSSFLFKNVDICGKIAVRPRREGDFIKIGSGGRTKTLKKLFIEKKIPVRKRALVPIISDDEGVLGIYGLGVGERAIPAHGDVALQIDFEEI